MSMVFPGSNFNVPKLQKIGGWVVFNGAFKGILFSPISDQTIDIGRGFNISSIDPSFNCEDTRKAIEDAISKDIIKLSSPSSGFTCSNKPLPIDNDAFNSDIVPTEDEHRDKSKKSKILAGAIVGTAVGVLFIGAVLLGLWLRGRGRNRIQEHSAIETNMPNVKPRGLPIAGTSDASSYASESPRSSAAGQAITQPVELEGSQIGMSQV